VRAENGQETSEEKSYREKEAGCEEEASRQEEEVTIKARDAARLIPRLQPGPTFVARAAP
jgi:hypothetical protein